MTALQLILTIPFLALWIFVALHVFEEFKLMMQYKHQISEEKITRHKKRFRILVTAMIIYIVFAILAFFISHLFSSGK